MVIYRKKGNSRRHWFFRYAFLVLSVFCLSCNEIQKPEPEPFYAETKPPPKQELRWSNGRLPKSLDPAKASAAPETDIVRALFEGLTDIDATSLDEVPAVAERWTSSQDHRVWTFQLRRNARWSNGKRVTADDFVTSWKRFLMLGDQSAHRDLIQNIAGLQSQKTNLSTREPSEAANSIMFGDEPLHHEQSNSTSTARAPGASPPANSAVNPREESKIVATAKPTPEKFGVEAVDDATLRVTLITPDRDFPKLVANPIFRPICGDGIEFETAPLNADIVTNGPFMVAAIGKEGVVLDRSDTYWNKSTIALERVKFVSKENAEAALSAYKNGEIDAVTNAEFEPLALKLLSPYEDFRQTIHSALNFYEFNIKNPPFNDRRVREALAISIDRERLTQNELEGTARPAMSFLPLSGKKTEPLAFNTAEAKRLLAEAGFAGGANFPKIRLLINRNDTQQRVARAAAKMWKQNLNLDTEIIVKDVSALDSVRASGEYDLIRRGIVLPTMDEAAGITAIFSTRDGGEVPPSTLSKQPVEKERDLVQPQLAGPNELSSEVAAAKEQVENVRNGILTEEDAMRELNAIPLYFPVAYSLIKPYVRGFEVNGLDAANLRDVNIDSDWRPMPGKGAS